jgi:hypothetical protein
LRTIKPGWNFAVGAFGRATTTIHSRRYNLKKAMQKQKTWLLCGLSLCAGFQAQAQLCSQSYDLPTALKNTIDIVGTVPEESLPKVVKNILKIGDGASTVADLNRLCGIVKDKDEVNGFLFGLDFVAKLTGAEVAPFVSVLTEIAGREIEAIQAIATSEAFANLERPSTIRFAIDIQSYGYVWNTTLSASEAARHIRSMDFLYADSTGTTQFFPVMLCTDEFPSTCGNQGLWGLSTISDEQSSPVGMKPYIRIAFKNGQKFILPVMPGYVRSPSADKFVFPFLWKKKIFSYNY